jgi:hypothetical protein
VKSTASRIGFAHTAGLVFLAAAEALTFLVVAKRHYAWSYPRWNDQVQYLGQAYDTFELARSVGYARAAWNSLGQVYAQGCLHGVLTLPVFAAVGASRTAALSLNILAFIALQAATFLTVRRISGQMSLAWASVGLLAALHFPWGGGAGSAVDFRLDWMAACAYGVTLAVALSGRAFRSTRWAVLFGAAAGVTVLLRFLTAVYFGIIFVAMLGWLLAQRERRARCARLVLSALVGFGIFAPSLWRSRHAIYGYYWVDHFAGPGRALHDSHFGALESMRWLAAQVVVNQLGLAAATLGVGAGAVLLALRADSALDRRKGDEGEGAWAIVLAFLAAPAAVLALHPIKAEPPASILIPGALWVVLLVWIRLAKNVSRRAAVGVGVGVLGLGVLVFFRAETRRSELDEAHADFRAINGLADFLFFRAEEARLTHPSVGVTWVLDGTDSGTLRILSYERHGRMMPFIATLPTGLFPTTREIVMTALGNSDFVCLASRAAPVWPFDRQMQELLPAMREWCDARMAAVGRLEGMGFSLSVYEARSVMPAAAGVDLASMIGAASRGPAYGIAGTPAAPVFVSSARAAGSTAAEFRYRIEAAHSPVRYRAVSLPEGFAIDPETGEIRGRFPRPGVYHAEMSASNPAGVTLGRLEVHVESKPWFAFLDAPSACSVGIPFEVKFGAFDQGGTLNFIDVSDLTTRTFVRRLACSDEDRQSWCGTCPITLEAAGSHLIVARFVRYDPSSKAPYTYIDHTFAVAAATRN